MTNAALLDRITSLLFSARWLQINSVKEQDRLLDQAQDCVNELKLRGDQLQLPFEDHAADS
jgi:hypothetical protein